MNRCLSLLVLLAGLPSLAHAHLMTTGLGPFYDGLAHLFVTPEDLLPIIALSLLAGLRGPGFGRTALFTLPLACLAGSLASLLVPSQVAFPLVGAALTISLGAMVAADLSLPLAAVAGFAIFLGLFSGGVSGSEMARAQGPGLSAIGAATAVFVVVALIAGNTTALKAHWARIAVRVAGSWIAASGLLMLGWALRKANQMKHLLTLMAVLEAPTGLALLVLPSLPCTLLLGSSLDAPVALTVARVAGVAILALGIACWIARHDGPSRAAKGLVGAMLLYNAGVVTLLVYAAMGLAVSGIALWPVVLLHAAMAAWCLTRLLNSPSQT